MSEKVIMSYRGTRFELGRGQSYFGIWSQGAPREHPLEQWPATPEGWSAAWSRFTDLEVPGTIASAERRPGLAALARDRVGRSAALLLAGVAIGTVGLFPDYVGGSLVSQLSNLVPHVIYLLLWAASAVLLLAGGTRARVGALLGAGASVVTFGLFLSDIGQAVNASAAQAAANAAQAAGSSAGQAAASSSVGVAGLTLACLGWLACAVGSVVAVRSVMSERAVVKPTAGHAGPLALLILASLATAAAFAPAWDSYVLRDAAGQSQTYTFGNMFSNPILMVIGDVAVLVSLVAVAVLAGLWRSPRLGAVLLAGGIAPMVAQAVSALIQESQVTPPSMFGISGTEAQQAGVTITNGLTPAFWLYCVFLAALVISCAWMMLTPSRPLTQPAGQVPSPWLAPQAEPDRAPAPGKGTADDRDATAGREIPGSADSRDTVEVPGSADGRDTVDIRDTADGPGSADGDGTGDGDGSDQGQPTAAEAGPETARE